MKTWERYRRCGPNLGFEKKELWTLYAVLVNREEELVFKVRSLTGQHPSFTCRFGKETIQHQNAMVIPLPRDANAAKDNAAEMLSEGTVMKTSATHKTILADMQDHFDTFLCIDK